MQKIQRLSTISILLAAVAMPATAQLREGERPTQEQVATGEAPATPIDESEKALRGLPNPAAAVQWSAEAARDLMAYLQRVHEEGLEPADYGVEGLNAALAANDANAVNVAATDAFLRLSSDLALGHIPADARVDYHMIDPDLDANAQYGLMQRAIQNNSVRDTLNSLLPTHPQYTELKGVLAATRDAAVKDKVRVNLDRWRWLPRDLGKRYVIVNVPAYTVALVEDGGVVVRHKAVVGAPKTPTPQLSAVATGVIFNPWWEVPSSIASEVRGKRGYVTVKSEDGSVRYRQPPGAGNSLGRMKVVMPNNHAIYLHDTPAKSLFSRDKRAFSHGCIRTHNALDFARVLLGTPEWDKSRVDKAIASGKTVKADGAVPTPVYVVYFTAAAAKDNGGILSYEDVYGRDSVALAAFKQKKNSTFASAAN